MSVPSGEVEKLKGAFLAIISHELRTPLTSIIAACDALDSGYLGALNPNQQQYVDEMKEAAEHLDSLIADLISFAQLQAESIQLRREPALLATLVGTTVDKYRSRAHAKDIQVVTAFTPGLTPIPVDAGKICRVAANLLLNAITYTPERGCVTVIVRASPGLQYFDVADTGPGIPPEKQALIFESFYQAEEHLTRQVGGLGIGLAYARRIVEAHKGRISVVSKPDLGSVFTVALPVDAGTNAV